MMMRFAGVAAALLVLAGCGDPVAPHAGDGGKPRRGFPPKDDCIVDVTCPTSGGGGGGATPDISVTISGPSAVTSAQTVVYTAAPSGGSGGYTYVWLEHVCYGAGNSPCADNVLNSNGTQYLHHTIASNVCTDEVTVQVSDSGGRLADATQTTRGPAC
ncbi:MAG TPA: hypothetical protein VFE05_03615 [Longimicrobiaceae bacterium]|jgi:hypothetical protein|nr:hypothetical protein [Longimicrobiaceae bacterium]